MSELKQAINALEMCQELMLFDPNTGEMHELWQENKDNQDLYNACTIAITAIQEKLEREKGCEYCNGTHFSEREDIPCSHGSMVIDSDNTLYFSTDEDECKIANTRTINFCPMCGQKLKGSDQHE